MDRVDLGLRLQSWHNSMHDPIYAVGSFYFAGHKYPSKEIVEDAISNLNADIRKFSRMLRGEKVSAKTAYGMTNDLRKFAGYTVREMRANVRELKGILLELETFLKEDYK